MICGDQVYDGIAENSLRVWTNFESSGVREKALTRRLESLLLDELNWSILVTVLVQLGL